MVNMRGAASFLAACLVALAACASPTSSSERSQDRIAALTRLGDSGTTADVPQVLPSLLSEDPLVRWTAQRALLRLAGTANGYDWAEPRPERRRAAEAWKTWCMERGIAPRAEEAGHG
jgi:hypothetical protein